MKIRPYRGKGPTGTSGWTFPVLLAVVMGGPAHAQEQPSINTGTDAEVPDSSELRELMNEHVINYLANEKVVAAGVGFINAQIGDPMAYVIKVWGEPLKKRKTGILGAIELMYQPDPNVAIVFTGKEEIQSISIKGNSAALFRTRRGARMGMTPITIARLYADVESETVRNRFEFAEQGIDFHFIDNKLDKVVVYDPK